MLNEPIKNMEWIGDAASGHLRMLDQTRLPGEEAYLECRDVQSVWDGIKRLSVRGAPAIGIAAAYGCVMGTQSTADNPAALRQAVTQTAEHLATSRPTAVNLFWALERIKRLAEQTADLCRETLLAEAKTIHREDAEMCRQIGKHAWERIQPLIETTRQLDGQAAGMLTHCNAGALATGGIGTATAPMYYAHEHGLNIAVFADETRPLLQGSRLTAYELGRAGIDVTLICDDMAAQVMREQKVACVITGADRIAANGDAANKIGTYNLAILAQHHGLPFFVAAPSSTFDLALSSGDKIPIEQRGAEEITEGFGNRTAPEHVKTYSPAFDVTPAELITAIFTEHGVIEPVDETHVRENVGQSHGV